MQDQCLSTTCSSQTWIFALTTGCSSAEYLKPRKNLHNITCIRASQQTLQPSLTAIHQINSADLLNASRNYMWLDAITISLLPFPVHFSTHFKPILFSQHTLLVVTNLCHITSSRPPKKKINLQSPPNALQECPIANFPTILYLDSKNTTKYLKKNKSHSNNPHAKHTTMDG